MINRFDREVTQRLGACCGEYLGIDSLEDLIGLSFVLIVLLSQTWTTQDSDFLPLTRLGKSTRHPLIMNLVISFNYPCPATLRGADQASSKI